MSTQAIEEVIKITATDAPQLLMDVMEAGLVPYMVSSPGIGKSDIAKEIAKKGNLFLIDMRLAGCDPTDLNKVAFAA
jgi:hypothetical protein